ncbi:MAG: hypothetical protein K0M50_17385 [Prolixibacteraceae bacterium]|nr:hypothetical protein [Prolixibacteraceae bacterium]
MAHNPKLEVFKIRLKPTTEKVVTYRDFFKQKLNHIKAEDSDLFKDYFDNFIDTVDNNDFFKDKKNHKAFTAYDAKKRNENPLNDTIRIHTQSHIIEGVVEGGRYGQSRSMANMANKMKKEKVGTSDIILDRFYFLIYTPLNSDTGILMLQSYSEDSIRDVFTTFIKPFFSTTGFYHLSIDAYVPKQYIDEFKKGAALKGISFTKNLLIGYIGKGHSKEELEEFNIRIEIKPNGHKSSLKKIKELIQKLSPIQFNENKLEEFSKRIYLENPKSEKSAYYDLEKDLDAIKPTIYLENRISMSIEGIPDFVELKDYCFNLLDTLKKEIQLMGKIHEC